VSSPRLRDERGFTLIETLVASIVLTVALVAVAQLMAVSIRLHQTGRDSATAARLAQDKVEEMMKMNFTTNPAIQVGGSLDTNDDNHFDIPANSGYTRRWQVAAGPAGNPRLRTVTVRLVPDVVVGAPFEVTTVIRSW
jgi:prepilin-type N-terminal cleavage/methylation domain-containing protein